MQLSLSKFHITLPSPVRFRTFLSDFLIFVTVTWGFSNVSNIDGGGHIEKPLHNNGGDMTHKLRIFFMAILLGGTAMLPSLRAEQGNKETTISFSAPVAVPGQVLPPGRYIFKVADSQSDRHIVQIFSDDQSQLVASVPAISAYRLEPSDDTLITFEEGPTGRPEAVKRWFCPGDLAGVAFMYPEDQQ